MAPVEKERSQSIMSEDNDSINREDFAHEMNEPEKKLKHICESNLNFLKEKPKSIIHRLKSYESLSKKGNSAINMKKIEKDSVLGHTNKHEIGWDYSVEGWISRPIVEVEIKSNDFSQSCIQFFLWSPNVQETGEGNIDFSKYKKPNDLKELMEESDDKSMNLHVIKNKLIGECYININKLFKDDIMAVRKKFSFF